MTGSSIILMEAVTKVGDGGTNIECDIVNISEEAIGEKLSRFLKEGLADPASMVHL